MIINRSFWPVNAVIGEAMLKLAEEVNKKYTQPGSPYAGARPPRVVESSKVTRRAKSVSNAISATKCSPRHPKVSVGPSWAFIFGLPGWVYLA